MIFASPILDAVLRSSDFVMKGRAFFSAYPSLGLKQPHTNTTHQHRNNRRLRFFSEMKAPRDGSQAIQTFRPPSQGLISKYTPSSYHSNPDLVGTSRYSRFTTRAMVPRRRSRSSLKIVVRRSRVPDFCPRREARHGQDKATGDIGGWSIDRKIPRRRSSSQAER